MRITREEFGHEYGAGIYRFGYCEFAHLEASDNLDLFYAGGYLPHSPTSLTHGTFYMARSARVPLAHFTLTSENRRIAKRFDNTFTTRELPAPEMSEDTKQLFVDYFAKRHGANVMSRERLEGILTWPVPLTLTLYEKDSLVTAATLEVRSERLSHFWFSAYDLSLIDQSLGMWLMLDGARRAKERGVPEYYLGTVYGRKALYKANLEPIEFWDGSVWNNDLTKLKELARAESK
jgi:arginyl-tRNA--protein-N-Asp/Glu arginylyltransferase